MNNIVNGTALPEVQVAKPTILSDTALMLLRHGAEQSDGMLLPPPAAVRARGKALELVLLSLAKAALVKEVAITDGQAIWRHDRDGNALGLKVTASGFAAVGVEPPAVRVIEAAAAHDAENKSDVGDADAAGREASGPAGSGPVPSPIPIDLAARRVTKKDQLVSLLSSPDGASIGALSVALEWQAHTVRAALTRLRQAGHALTRSKKDDGTVVYQITAPSSLGSNDCEGPAREGLDGSGEGSCTAAIQRAVPIASEASA